MLGKDKELAMYYPSDFTDKKKLDREFVFNILNTVHPGYLDNVIAYANKQRHTSTEDTEKKTTILLTPEW